VRSLEGPVRGGPGFWPGRGRLARDSLATAVPASSRRMARSCRRIRSPSR